jgi:gamma-glutamylputrescine oxidase
MPLFQSESLPLSYWEHKTWYSGIDVLIIGSGLVGLNAALSLNKKAPALKILVLERGQLPSGASTKNAGFACFGSPSELLDDLCNQSEESVLTLVEKRWKGLLRLRKNLGDAAIDYQGLGGYEVFAKGDDYACCADSLSRLNKLMAPVIGLKSVYASADKKIASFGLKNFPHMILNRAEGQINTGKMMQALLAKVQSKGILILNNTEIATFEDTGNGVVLTDTTGKRIEAKKMLVATNGFARTLMPELDVQPARAQVLVTSVIKDLKLKGTFHLDKGYYYFRNIDGRVLLGGGRNLDRKTEETMEFGLTPLVQNKLEELLHKHILPGKSFEIEHRWSGIMGVGKQKNSIVKSISKQVYCAVRMGGMGVAIGSLVGEEAATLLLKDV